MVMKFINVIATIALIAFLATAVWFMNKTEYLSPFKSSSNTEQILNKEETKEKTGFENADMTPINESKPGSNSVFSYNFLFNLLYKFAYGELKR
jgi:hypothetical protein